LSQYEKRAMNYDVSFTTIEMIKKGFK
jgi:hypothetical protein